MKVDVIMEDPPPPPKVLQRVVIELEPDEARALHRILGKSQRGSFLLDRLAVALESALGLDQGQ